MLIWMVAVSVTRWIRLPQYEGRGDCMRDEVDLDGGSLNDEMDQIATV